ncbi:DnaB-like helicase N-terminal domain-containing protein, partial [Streptomyces alkaliphilus]
MPHTPDDDLDTVDPAPPVYHAERALLGALLLEPRRLQDAAHLVPEAFSTAEHRALFTAIRSLPAPDPARHARRGRG